MPAIRGVTFGYETTTTDAGVVIPVCANQTNDLLVAICMADTGSLSTFTSTPPTGWNILQEWYNTNPFIAYFKLSGGSETDLTVAATTHATTNETYNGSMFSVRDIDTTTPCGMSSLSSYGTANQDSTQALGDGSTTAVSQSFSTPAATAATNARGCFARAQFYLRKNGSPTFTMKAKLYAHSGTFGTSSVPTGTALATSNAVNASTLTGSYQLVSFYFPSTWYQFAASTNYVISVEYDAGTIDGANYVEVGYDSSSAGHAGNTAVYNGSVWTAYATRDLIFDASRFTFNFANNSAASRSTMSSVTTDRDNSLVVHMCGGSGSTGTPSLIEGPVYGLLGADGAAESHALGWTFVPTAGASPNNIVCSMVVTGASVKGGLICNPPTSGATVIPTYCTEDLSTYINPIAGTTGYNSDTGLAATADTNYGTSLGSYTANDATVAAVTDAGINSFHSLGGLTNAAVAGQVSGAEVVIAAANRFNFSSKNLLCHVRLSSPANAQRFPPVASGRGAWMGVRSNTSSGGATTGYKIWQIRGVDSPWGFGDHVPIVINNSNTDTKATSGTLDASVITSIGFWTSGISTLTAQVGFGSAWLMDTTTVAGGSTSEPISISGIVGAVGLGHERYSAKLQGAKQAIILQSVQIGNGGTNPVKLNLDGTAIEFPRQYNAATAEVNYCSVDNKCGLSYYPGASDTITHKNSVVSSASRYTWGLHASASTSATYDFSGLNVIGAGTISLARAITITGLTINDYSTLDISGLTLTSSTILNVAAANDSLTTSASTSVSGCSIDVSRVTEGNRWASVASPAIFSSSTFTGGGGHALRITTAGTYSLTSLTWSSFGPTVAGFNTTSDVNASTNVVTIGSHGYTTGDGIRYMKQGGTANIGLTDNTTYYVRAVTSSTLAFYTSPSNAISDTSRIALTSTGSETHYINSLKAAIWNDSGGSVTLNVTGGTTPTIRNGASSTTTLVINPVDTTITVKDIVTGSAISGARVLVTASDNTGPMPYQESVTITRSGATATVSHTSHGLVDGKKVLIKGANQQEYNGVFTVSVTGTNSYTYTVSGSPATPATGTIVATGVVIDGTTNGSGVITDNRSHASNQPITGRVRKATSGTLYKTGSISGTISSTTGFSTTVQLIPDS